MIEDPRDSIKVSFELSADDMAHFRARLDQARADRVTLGEAAIVARAKSQFAAARESHPPQFILRSMERLGLFIAMLEDADWRLEGEDRARVLDVLAYFVDPDDMIPDHVPGVGLLDDAIMVELVVGELRHEIEAFEEFVAFRADQPAVPEVATLLSGQRDSLQRRMRRRSRIGGEGVGAMKSPFRLF